MGTLYVVATPIGNLEDITARALRVLGEVDLIAAEDTRRTRALLTHFGIRTPTVSYHAHNERRRRERLLDALARGDVALVTDAGTPAVSDPGADLIAAARAAGHRVTPIPGPSSLTAAVSVSGLVEGPFLMLGFLPRERAPRQRWLAAAAASRAPVVLFEAPGRVAATLRDLRTALGDRPAVAARELTKLHEEIRAGALGALAAWAEAEAPRGEFVVVVAGAPTAEAEAGEAEDAATLARALRRQGMSPSAAARELAALTGMARSDAYDLIRRTPAGAGGSVGLEGEFAVAHQDALEDALGDEEGPER